MDAMTMGTLRPSTPGDWPLEEAWLADDELNRLDPPQAGWGPEYRFIVLDENGRPIGTCSVYNVSGDSAAIGIRIGERSCWGKGYGTEAVKQLLDWCFDAGLEVIRLRVLAENLRAIGCYRKCGFAPFALYSEQGRIFVLMEKRRPQDGQPQR